MSEDSIMDTSLEESLNIKSVEGITEIKTYMEGIVKKYLPMYRVIWSEKLVKSTGICYWKTALISFRLPAILEFASDWDSNDHDECKSHLTLLTLHEVAHGIWKEKRKKYEPVHGKRFQEIAEFLVKNEDLEMYMEFIAGSVLKELYYTGNCKILEAEQ